MSVAARRLSKFSGVCLATVLLAACGAAATSSPVGAAAHGALLAASRASQAENSFAISGAETVESAEGETTVDQSGYAYRADTDPTTTYAALTTRTFSSSSPGPGTITSTELVIGNKVFVGIPSDELGDTTLDGAKWIESNNPGLSSTIGDILGKVNSTDPIAPLALLARKTHLAIANEGQVVIAGHETTEYSADISPSNFLETSTTSRKSEALDKEIASLKFSGPVRFTVWIGTHGLMRQELIKFDFSQSGSGSSGSSAIGLTMKIDMSRYGAAFPVLAAPTSGVISSITYEADVEAEAQRAG